MSLLFGLLTSAATAYVTYQLATAAFGNAGAAGRTAGVLLIALAAIGSFLAGSSAFRRARRSHHSLGLFSALAFSFWFAVVGGAFAVALVATYTAAYAPSGTGPTDNLLTILAYPVLALFGFCLGALCGWLVGLLASGALRVLAPAAR